MSAVCLVLMTFFLWFFTVFQSDLGPSAAKFLSACLISSTFKLTLDLLHCNLVRNHLHQVVAHMHF